MLNGAAKALAAAAVNTVLDCVRGYVAARDWLAARKESPFGA